MALCLANSLVARRDYVPYDQLVRYKWWYRHGYMSSVGHCFDIGSATKHALAKFENRQEEFAEEHKIPLDQLDYLSDSKLLNKFNVHCGAEGAAGNGALMRLAPVPLFFYQHPTKAVEFSGHSGLITHGDRKAYDACRYYGALIMSALHGEDKEQMLDEDFYSKHEKWFNNKPLHAKILEVAKGSYKKDGYDQGIRGNGYIVDTLKAALWAFWSDNGDFEKGVLAVVNLGDDTDTTAAIYGQLAGAYYGYEKLPKKWVEQVYAKTLISGLSKWMVYEGSKWLPEESATSTISSVIVESASRDGNQSSFERARCSSAQPWTKQDQKFGPNSSAEKLDATSNLSSKFEQLNSHNAGHRSRQNNLLQPDPLVRSTSNRRSTSSHPKPPQHDDLTSVSKRKSSKFLTDNIE
ncbi:unnamed protein product [Rotaria sp. Silwood2]|nr:unnamed protein product [Rotaria sp. Silwood2]CAF2712407.1 unnamed protein product [Rotaria sp. Silwood2]CAF2954497.1 unnamed protein product [Rotaria sp. Silwood2]CAF3939962.1 unnamed protein product [Rotaria sp. Silwood2]CAF3984181.1 unnamed protein product [Rotaria sp. Silwood2]